MHVLQPIIAEYARPVVFRLFARKTPCGPSAIFLSHLQFNNIQCCRDPIILFCRPVADFLCFPSFTAPCRFFSDHWPLRSIYSLHWYALQWHFTEPVIWRAYYCTYLYFMSARIKYFTMQGYLSAGSLLHLGNKCRTPSRDWQFIRTVSRIQIRWKKETNERTETL